MEELEIEETKASTVPQRFACPVCGHWGRSHELSTHFYRNGQQAKWSRHEQIYFCNPKARKGGAGCGEYFNRATVTGCDKIMDAVAVLQNETNGLDYIVSLGFKMVEMLKRMGLHDPFRRKIEAKAIYGPWRSSEAVKFNESGLCGCGCGRSAKTSGRGPHYATWACKDSIWEVARMIGQQDEGLKILLVRLRGDRCEKCATEPHAAMKYKSKNYRGGHGLEVDHIREVVSGGGMCWIDNYQLLCVPCHKAKTAKFAADRAIQRKAEKRLATGQQSLFV